MIKRARINGYKSLDEVDVRLAPLTVVFGSNAAGKSNLLDALALLSRLVTSETLDAAFKAHRGAPLEAFTFERGGVAELQERAVVSFAISVDVELSDAVVHSIEAELLDDLPVRVVERELRYSLTVQISTASGQLRVVDERAEAVDESGEPKPGRPFLGDEWRLRERRLLRSEVAEEDQRRGEIIAPNQTALSKVLDPSSHPHLAAQRPELEQFVSDARAALRQAAAGAVDRS